MMVSKQSDIERNQVKWRRRALAAAAAALTAGTLLAEMVWSAEPPVGPYGQPATPSAASTRLGDYIQKSTRRTSTNGAKPASAKASGAGVKPAGVSLSDRGKSSASPAAASPIAAASATSEAPAPAARVRLGETGTASKGVASTRLSSKSEGAATDSQLDPAPPRPIPELDRSEPVGVAVAKGDPGGTKRADGSQPAFAEREAFQREALDEPAGVAPADATEVAAGSESNSSAARESAMPETSAEEARPMTEPRGAAGAVAENAPRPEASAASIAAAEPQEPTEPGEPAALAADRGAAELEAPAAEPSASTDSPALAQEQVAEPGEGEATAAEQDRGNVVRHAESTSGEEPKGVEPASTPALGAPRVEDSAWQPARRSAEGAAGEGLNPTQRVLKVIGLKERRVESTLVRPRLPHPAGEASRSDLAPPSFPQVTREATATAGPTLAQPVAQQTLVPSSPAVADEAPIEEATPATPARDRGTREEGLRLAQQPAAPPAAPPQNAPPVEEAGPPEATPFEVIDETGELKVTMRRSKLLVLKREVARIAIVDPAIADVVQYTPRELSVVGKAVGATHVTLWFDDENRRPVTYLVTVEPDIKVRQQIEEDYKKLEGLINELFPDSYVRLIPMADKVIVKGQARDAEEAAQILALLRNQQGGGGGGGAGMGMMSMGIQNGFATQLYNPEEMGNAARPRLQVINMLRVPGVHQVALRVKIAELNRTAARNFGVGIGGNVNFTSNPKGSQLFIQSMLGLASGGTGGGAAAPTFLAQFDGDDIRVGIRYMQQAGVLRLLSEPTLVTLSGQPATFVAGGEFAVPTLVGSVGLNAVTTDFRAYGALIAFNPTVVDKDRIRLQVSPEFSQINSALTNAQTGTPGLNVRAVTTTVEMREGQTFAIAGLLEDTMKSATGSDMPFLHKIFGAREVSRTETELIILVTPELVHPMDPEEVPPLPGFDVTEPSNHQFYLKGDIEGTPTRDWRHTVWPRLRQRYNAGGSAMISGPFGHGQ